MKQLLSILLLLPALSLTAQDTLRITSDNSGSFELITFQESDQQTQFAESSQVKSSGAIVTTMMANGDSERKIASVNKLKTSLSVYPNPGKGIFYVGSSTHMKEMFVITPLGEIILTKNLCEMDNPSFDISNTPAGMYFLKIVFLDSTERMLRIVKQ